MFAIGVAVVAFMLWALAAGPGAGRAHDVPVGVVGPGLAAELLSSDQVTHTGTGQLTSFDDRASATEAVRSGRVVAAVVMDLAKTRDDVLVDRSRNPELQRTVLAEIRATENIFGRTIRVVEVNADRSGQAHRVDWAVVTAAGIGFLIGLGAVIVRWARYRPTGRVPRVVIVLVASSAVVASGTWQLFGPFPGPDAADLAVLFATTICAAVLPLSFAAAAEFTGMAWALLIFAPTLLPALLHIDGLMLPQPWRFLHEWTQLGAAREALAAPGIDWKLLLVLLAWWMAISVVGFTALERRGTTKVRPLPLTTSVLAAVPALALVLASAWLLPTDTVETPDTQSLASTTECQHTGTPQNIKQINTLVQTTKGQELFGGGDVGASAQLQDGRSVWVFGDSVRTSSGRPGFVRNSMLLFDTDCLAVVVPADKGAVIPDRGAVGYWPMSMTAVHRPGYDLLTVSASRVRTTGDGSFDFEGLGPSAAVFLVPRGGVPQLLQVTDFASDNNDATAPTWGAALAHADGWAYVYGTAQAKDAFGYSLRVARVRPETALDQRTWQYWDGSDWVREASRATVLIDAVKGVSQTLSVWKGDNGTWYALSKRDEFLGTDLVVWSAPSPEGPFTANPPVAQIPSNAEAGQLRYMPLAHPELLPRTGSVVVSYSNNRTDANEILKDPTLYRPTFLRVPLP